jgi:multicomponent Na+:H+ antiporter subunit B
MEGSRSVKNSLFLATVVRLVFPILWAVALFLFLRGHQQPGGGFIAGLLSSIAYLLMGLAFDVKTARKMLTFPPPVYIAVGLLTAFTSGLLGLLYRKDFFTGIWWEIPLPLSGAISVGTPVFFDLGVFLVVLGVVTWIVFVLLEEKEEFVDE